MLQYKRVCFIQVNGKRKMTFQICGCNLSVGLYLIFKEEDNMDKLYGFLIKLVLFAGCCAAVLGIMALLFRSAWCTGYAVIATLITVIGCVLLNKAQ